MMNFDAKIFVTGHGGMVGKTMLGVLEEEGYENVVFVSSEDLDLRNQIAVFDFFEREKPEYVFHFAAKVGGIMANINNPAVYLYDNLMISCNVVEAARRFGVKKLLNLGSSCVYPRGCEQPMKEEYLLDGKPEPTNEGYALAKIAALKLCEKYNKQYGTNFISLMPCNLYGVNEHFDAVNSHVVAALIMKFDEAKRKNLEEVSLWGTGSVRREFLYVRDLVEICLQAMKKLNGDDFEEGFVNVGSGEDISIRDLAEMIREVVGFEGKIAWDSSKPDGMPRKLVDVSKMRKHGLESSVGLREGIGLTYEYFLKKL